MTEEMSWWRCYLRLATLLLLFGTLAAWAQDDSDPVSGTPRPNVNNTLTSLAGEFFQGDFFNYYAYFNGVYDSANQTLQSANSSGIGFSFGGGVSGSKRFSTSTLSLAYRGEYRRYAGGFGGNGTNQSLNLIYSRRLSARWQLSFAQSAGILFYNNGYFTSVSSGGIPTNPFSPTTRFLQSSAYLSYRQTQRLSYTFGGNFFLTRYSFGGAIGSTGGIFSVSASYALTARTTVGGTFSHDNFYFQHDVGNSNIDGGYADIKHTFGRRWLFSASAGVTRAHTSGIIRVPVQVILGDQILTGYATQAYDTTSLVPTFRASISHAIGRYNLSASAGRGVNAGNGAYLTSDHTYFGGVVSRPLGRQSVLSGSAFYSRVTSIANAVRQSFTQYYLNASYSRLVLPHVSTYLTYSYNRYGTLLGLDSRSDNRIIFGVSFSSKSIPLTLF